MNTDIAWTQLSIWLAALMLAQNSTGWILIMATLSLLLCLVVEVRDYLRKERK